VLSILLVTFGGIAMNYFTDTIFLDDSAQDKGIAMASFAILAAVAYMADCVVAAIKYRR